MLKTVVITGGGGFLGSNLAHHLGNIGGYRIIIVDSFGNDKKWQNLVRATIDEIVAPENFFYWLEMFGQEVEIIYNLGGISATTEHNVSAIIEANHDYPLLLWRWCIENDKRFVFASSAEVYGAGEMGFDDKLDVDYIRKLRPLNPNGWSKKLFDLHVAQAHARNDKMPAQWVGLRFFNLYGPNEYHKQDQRSVMLKIYEEASQGIAVRLFKSKNPEYPDGSQQRDFIYVKDAVAVMEWLLLNPRVNGIFNCGTGKARSFAELAQAIFSSLGKEPNVKYVDMPHHIEHQYQYRTEAVIDRLRQAGYDREFMSLEDGVADYINNYLRKDDMYL